MKAKTFLVLVIVFCLMFPVMVSAKTFYSGILGDYKDYSPQGEFNVVRDGKYLNGTVTYQDKKMMFYGLIHPIPILGIHIYPGLYHGYIKGSLFTVRGIIIFFGENSSFMYGSFSQGLTNGWFTGEKL